MNENYTKLKDFAQKRLGDSCKNGNDDDVRYWVGYIDGLNALHKEMSDYIDRDLLLAEIKKLKKSPWYNGGYGTYERNIRREAIDIIVDLCIRPAPAAGAQEIKHGEWIKYRPENALDGAYFCSTCFKEQKMADGTITPLDIGCYYCPHCGAKMDGGNNNA